MKESWNGVEAVEYETNTHISLYLTDSLRHTEDLCCRYKNNSGLLIAFMSIRAKTITDFIG